MNKLVFLIFVCVVAVVRLSAQEKDVTKFLGIPVDGTKSAMVQKLCRKGFVYDRQGDFLEGEFNGRNVIVRVVTNNNKIWRIMVADAVASDETDIKIRFNTLCRQFAQNSKYLGKSADYIIPDDEDVSYQILVGKKRYEAVFYQLALPLEQLNAKREALKLLEETKGLSEEKEKEAEELFFEFGKALERSVWFMIDESYGRYKIWMYYDNECNGANGEDL